MHILRITFLISVKVIIYHIWMLSYIFKTCFIHTEIRILIWKHVNVSTEVTFRPISPVRQKFYLPDTSWQAKLTRSYFVVRHSKFAKKTGTPCMFHSYCWDFSIAVPLWNQLWRTVKTNCRIHRVPDVMENLLFHDIRCVTKTGMFRRSWAGCTLSFRWKRKRSWKRAPQNTGLSSSDYKI
jgi:hypothetical protein